MATNLYLLLGIFDFNDNLAGTADDDARVRGIISQAWNTKLAEWSKLSSKNPKKASAAKNNIEQSKSRAHELDTVDAREAAWSEAKAIIDKTIAKKIDLFSQKKYLLEGEIAHIVQLASKESGVEISEAYVRALVPQSLEIRMEEGPQGKELKKPESFNKFNTAAALLGTYGYGSLYGLLGKPMVEELPKHELDSKSLTVSASQLKAWADEDKSKLPTKATAVIGDHKKLFELCDDAFSSEQTRHSYDEYLAFSDMSKVVDEALLSASVSKRIDNASGSVFVRRMCEAYAKHGITLSQEDAGAHLTALCEKKGIIYAMPASSPADGVDYEICPWCGTFNETDAKMCVQCGGSIQLACPQCNNLNRADVKHCSNCGFDYGNMRKASLMLDEAKLAATALKFDEAEGLLAEADRLWQRMPDIAPLRADIAQREEELGPLRRELSQAMAKRQYCQAHDKYLQLQKRAPEYNEVPLMEQINAHIAAAKQIMDETGNSPDRTQALAVFDECADYPGLEQIFAGNAPKPCGQVQVVSDGVERRNVVSWQPSPTDSVVYHVLRKLDSPVLNIGDGEEMANTAGAYFNDTDIEPNAAYYYAVYASFGPASSSLEHASEAAVNLFEIQHAEVNADEDSIRVTWRGLPKNAEIEVWRNVNKAPSKPGEGIQVSNVVNTGLQDSGLVNGTTYWYTMFVKYKTSDGSIRYSDGVSISGTPSTPPEPIMQVIPQLKDDGSFDMEWDMPPEGECRFLLATEKPGVEFGESVGLSELCSTYEELQVESTGSGRGNFTLPDESIYYLIPLTVRNEEGVVGTITTVTSKRVVHIDKIVGSNGKVSVLFDWPQEECSKVLLLWSDTHVPAGPYDSNASRKLFNRKTYDLEHAITVNSIDDRLYHFSLFAQLGAGDSISYSAPSSMDFSFTKPGEIIYRVKTNTLFGRIRSATLVLQSDGDIPPCQLRVNRDRIPVFANQGRVALEVPRQQRGGVHEIEIPKDAIEKGQHYRLFFQDDNDYDSIELTHEAGFKPEIG